MNAHETASSRSTGTAGGSTADTGSSIKRQSHVPSLAKVDDGRKAKKEFDKVEDGRGQPDSKHAAVALLEVKAFE